jgi:hypothetical protein
VSLFVPLLLLLAACLVALVSRIGGPSSAPSTGPRVVDFEGQSLNVRLVKDKTAAAAIAQARRAVVFVDAPYSVYALKNGQQFLRGMLYVSQKAPAVNAEVYWIENDAEDWCKGWITALGVDGLIEVAVPVGNGAILWMESGKVVRFQPGQEIQGAYEIKESTLQLWKGSG